VAGEVDLEQHVGAGAPVGRVEPQHVAAAAGVDGVVIGQPAAVAQARTGDPRSYPSAATVAIAAPVGRGWATSMASG
jgi:hypothetical protein